MCVSGKYSHLMVFNNNQKPQEHDLYDVILSEICIDKTKCAHKDDLDRNKTFRTEILIKRTDNTDFESELSYSEEEFEETNLVLEYSRFYNTNSKAEIDFHFDLWTDPKTQIDNVSFYSLCICMRLCCNILKIM